MRLKYHPQYEFGEHIGPSFEWFAWYPVRLWYGRMVWMRKVSCQRVQKRSHLDGHCWQFWSYADA
jgi:hypothetical protein